MKKVALLCSAVALLIGMASCDSGGDYSDKGRGYLSLGLTPNPVFSSKVRAIDEAEYKNPDNYTVLVTDGNGNEAFKGLYKDMPLEVELIAGKTYTVKATYGENPEVAFDKLYVEGNQQFTIADGEQKNLSLTCRPANVKVSVVYTENFLKYYSDCTVYLNKESWQAPFTMNMVTDANKDAYVKAQADGESLSIDIRGFKDKNGNPVSISIPTTTKVVKPKMYLTITVDPEEVTISTGSASLDVTVDPGTEDKDVNIEIPEEYWPGNAGK